MDNLLETVGSSGGPQDPLSLAVSRPIQRVDIVAAILPDVAPERVGPPAQPGHKYHISSRRARQEAAGIGLGDEHPAGWRRV